MNTLKSFFPHLDMASEAALLLPLVGGLLLLLLAAWLSGAVFRRVVTPLILKVVARTHAVWDDYIFNRHVLGSASHVVPGCVFYLFLPFVFGDEQALSFPDFHELLLRGTRVYITVTVVRLFCAFFSNVGRLTSQEEDFNSRHYLVGIMQFLKLTVIAIGLVAGVSYAFGQSPLSLIAGLGAVATVFAFIFKDTLLGLVAGIQLSANKMVKPGDWITMPKYDVNGIVEEVSLVTVKIRNFDNTISTLPPYTLVSDSFRNWKGMADGGGRRVKRALYVDINSVRPVTAEQAGRYADSGRLPADTPRQATTNLTLFRRYVEHYLTATPRSTPAAGSWRASSTPRPTACPSRCTSTSVSASSSATSTWPPSAWSTSSPPCPSSACAPTRPPPATTLTNSSPDPMTPTDYLPAAGRYDGTMPYRRSGQSGILLPALALGLWKNFGHAAPYATSRALVHYAFDHGMTHLDLANNYGPPPGSAEETLGRILDDSLRPYRDELFISTKAGYEMWPGPYGNWGSRKSLMASLDQSLRRMRLDYVDLFYTHRYDPATPLDETLQALVDIVRAGKALYVGISRWPLEATRHALDYLRRHDTPCLIYQGRLNLLDRAPQREGITQLLQTEGVGFISFSPLAQGLLTARYLDGIPADSRMRHEASLRPDALTPDLLSRLSRLQALAADSGRTVAQTALQWVLAQGATSVLVGASRTEQLAEDIATLQLPPLTPEELQAIEEIMG